MVASSLGLVPTKIIRSAFSISFIEVLKYIIHFFARIDVEFFSLHSIFLTPILFKKFLKAKIFSMLTISPICPPILFGLISFNFGKSFQLLFPMMFSLKHYFLLYMAYQAFVLTIHRMSNEFCLKSIPH